MTIPSPYLRVSLSDFRATFPGKPPCANSLKKWIAAGTLPGEMVGTMYYVHLDHQGNLYRPALGNQTEPASAAPIKKDDLFNKLTKGFMPTGGCDDAWTKTKH